MGDADNVTVEGISFDECYADGLHINGNIENILIRNIKGHVEDDLVALNMYDWQDSSVNFGPLKTALVENLRVLSDDNGYEGMRIQSGIYYYQDSSSVDCSISDAIFKDIKGVRTFKMYLQTPPYDVVAPPEVGNVGSCDNLFFEDIEMDLNAPIDPFEAYLTSDSIKGSFAAFEIGANIHHISFSNISLTLHRETYPMSFFLCVGPKSVRIDGREIFDPFIRCQIDHITLHNIRINGRLIKEFQDYIHEIIFDDIYGDGIATGRGIIKHILCKE